MSKWKLKACPRCNGDCFVDTDLDGQWFEECLQCGYRGDLEIEEVKKDG